MKFEANWMSKSLESLEKHVWPALDPDEGSHLIISCNALRKKQLKDLSTEDLRVLIGQDIGLNYLIPLALEKLQSDLQAEGDLYKGDLLMMVLTSDKKYWKDHKNEWSRLVDLFDRDRQALESDEELRMVRTRLFKTFEEFKSIHLH